MTYKVSRIYCLYYMMLKNPLHKNPDTLINLMIQEQAVSYTAKELGQPLVSEIWAIREKCNKPRAEKIVERANLPLKWFDKTPSMNGEKGIEKLQIERGVLLLKNRTSPFIEQFNILLGGGPNF